MTAMDEGLRVAIDAEEEPSKAAAAAAGAGLTSPYGDRPCGDLPYGDLPYGERIRSSVPALHSAFNWMNRWFGAPALRLGLGRYWSTPLAGYMMLLRTRGRKSGLRREAPLGYVIVGDAVYCMAGFGRKTFWFRNLLADPRVEVVLPDRAFTGLAEEVTDPEELRRVVRPLAGSMAIVAMLFTGKNPRTVPDDELMRVFGAFPIVRIRQTGIAAGPNDPGGWGWLVSTTIATLATLWLVGSVRRVLRRAVGRS